MNKREILLDALQYYGIDVVDSNLNNINIEKGYSIEIESNGLYKLLSDNQVIAPFDDIDELCRFILL